MTNDLKQRVHEMTWHEVVFFQLRSLELPQAFENEIENTEVKGQDILKAEAEKKRELVRFETNQILAKLSVNATLELAYGQANKTLYEAEAVADTIVGVTKSIGEAIKEMKDTL